MIKSLKDARITDGLPRVVAGQDWVIALSEALGVLHEKTLDFTDKSQIYTAIDTAPIEILDALAVNWKIDWYDTEYGEEQKRRIIKTALTVRRLMGTAYATRLQADAIFPGTRLEEWFDYDGTPGTFRLFVDISNSSPEAPAKTYDTAEMERRLVGAKRWSAHLESFSFMIRRALIIKHTVKSYRYNPPECGTIYCGAYWMPSHIGYTERPELVTKPKTEAFGYTADFAGTLPNVATVGYAACGSMRAGARAEAYDIETAAAGTENSGVLPVPAAAGGSVDATLNTRQQYKSIAEAYSGTPFASGVIRCGEEQ